MFTKVLEKPLFKEFILLSLSVAVLHAVATHFDLYWTTDYSDILMHFLGGAMVSVAFLWFYFYSGLFSSPNRNISLYFLIAILGTVLVSVSWEIFELLMDAERVGDIGYASDTTLDFIMDLVGALVASFYSYYSSSHSHQNHEIY